MYFPWAPNVLFWAQCCWIKLLVLLIKIILVVFRYSVKSVAPYIVFLVAPGSWLARKLFMLFFLINNSCCFRCSVRSYNSSFFSIPSQFLFWVANAPRAFFQPKQKIPLNWRQLTIVLTIIVFNKPLSAQCVVLGAIVVGLSCFSLSRQEVDWRESCLCCFFLINNSCCFRCSVRSYIVPFFFYPFSIFVLGCQCASRILPTQTKNTLELTIIDNCIDINCLKNIRRSK